MNFRLWRWLKGCRLDGLGKALLRLPGALLSLLELPIPEKEQFIRRVTTMERDIILPLKAAGVAMLLYSFYFSPWVGEKLGALDVAVEWTQYLLWFYIGANVLVAGLLLSIRRLRVGLAHWVVFATCLLDGLFLSTLTVLTGGYQSLLYWLFLGLIVRGAVSVPRATSQLALNFTVIACYVLAGLISIYIEQTLELESRATTAFQMPARQEAGGRGTELAGARKRWNGLPADVQQRGGRATVPAGVGERSSPPVVLRDYPDGLPDETSLLSTSLLSPTDPLLVRLLLLLLVAVCSYGVQVLFERQRRAAEEAREFAVRDAQLRSAGRFAAEFAHQIKNPLAIINNAAYSLHRALGNAGGEARAKVGMIQEEVQRADRIITEVMGYAQLTEGHVEKLNAVEQLDQAIERVFPRAAQYPVRVHRKYAPALPPLLMQRRHASEIFINLLQNAREALGERGGQVFVNARGREDAALEVVIRDTGPGIRPDRLGRVFEAYYTTKEKGTGLGLATVRQDVELYGGSVRVESELGKGAAFTLVFPSKALMRQTDTV